MAESKDSIHRLGYDVLMIIADHVHRRDVNSLTQASKHLKSQFLRRLYRDDVLQDNDALKWAVRNGKVDTIASWIELGDADVNEAFHVAATGRHYASSETPLALAIRHCQRPCVKYLLARGADANGEVEGRTERGPPDWMFLCHPVESVLWKTWYIDEKIDGNHGDAEDMMGILEDLLHHGADPARVTRDLIENLGICAEDQETSTLSRALALIKAAHVRTPVEDKEDAGE
ncbi:hypothetical protein SCUP515_05227 [Seiridium cupressi]